MGTPPISLIAYLIAEDAKCLQLDIVSASRHFGQTVPRLAITQAVLYYACLAYASHVLCLQGDLPTRIEQRYLDKAIGMLIPALSSHASPYNDESLLATTVILRMSEQFSEIGDDGQHHLKGAFSLFSHADHKWSPSQLDVKGVAFWIYLRESIRICFLHEQNCNFDMSLVEDKPIEPTAAEEVWTNRMTYLLAKLCNACWSNVVDESEMTKIDRSVEEWRESLPETFEPWCYRKNQDEAFPIIKFVSTWHGMYRLS